MKETQNDAVVLRGKPPSESDQQYAKIGHSIMTAGKERIPHAFIKLYNLNKHNHEKDKRNGNTVHGNGFPCNRIRTNVAFNFDLMKKIAEEYAPKNKPLKWYQEPTFKQALLITNSLSVAMTIGISFIDKAFYWPGLLIIAGINALIIGSTYFLRNNP